MSMVKMVELELKMEVREDMRAASMTASMRPRTPTGIFSFTSLGGGPAINDVITLSWRVKGWLRALYTVSWGLMGIREGVKHPESIADVTHGWSLDEGEVGAARARVADPLAVLGRRAPNLVREQYPRGQTQTVVKSA